MTVATHKQQIARELAEIVVENWIVTGDRHELERRRLVRSQYRNAMTLSVQQIENQLANISRLCK